MMVTKFDLLSQMLTLIRLRGELVFSSDLREPWALQFDPGPAYFHVVSEGEFWVETSNERPVKAVSGDLLMLPHGRGHWLRTADASPVSITHVLEAQAHQESLAIRLGGNGPRTQLVSGAFRFEGENMPSILESLPSLIHIPKDKRVDEIGWLEALAHYLLLEAQAPQPGAALMISRLIDLVVIRTLRNWVHIAPARSTGWLGALADVRISRALKAVHDEPFRRWTVSGLAQVAGMSRSSFAERFTALVGDPPLQYQTHWRLTLAKDLLESGNLLVSDVARRIGYDSDAAFSRAFKTQFGFSPIAARKS